MNLMDLFIKIGVDDNASGNINKITANVKNAAKVGAAALTTITVAVTAMTTSIIKGASELAVYGDKVDKMSQKMGLSAQAYQEWDFIMQHCGTSIESLQASIKTLATAAENGNDAFTRLGISQSEIASMNQEELFTKTIEQLQKVENETERTYLAGQLLGRGATELGALLNTSAEETEAMRRQVHELGGVMSNEAVKAAAAYQDSLQNLQTAFDGLKRGLLSKFLPVIVDVMDGLSLIFSGKDSGLSKFADGVNKFVDKLKNFVSRIVSSLPKITKEIVPGVLRTVIDAIVQIVQSIAQYLPEITKEVSKILEELSTMLAPAVVAIIISLLTALTHPDVAVSIFETSGIIIANLVEGLIIAAPDVAAAGPEIVMNIIQGILRSTGSVSILGVKIVFSLINGIINAVSKIQSAVKQLWSALKNGFLGIVEDAKTWGSDLIDNFVNGIKGSIGKLKSAVVGIADTVKEYIGFSEPEKGPLSNFHTYAPDMIDLFTQGIKENEWKLTDQISKSFNFKPAIESGADADAAVSGTTNDINININIDGSGSAQDIASAVSYELQRLLNRRSAVYG